MPVIRIVRAQRRPAAASCDDLLLPPREVSGKKVGPTSCLKQETALTLDGRKFVRLDLGLDGTVDGLHHQTGDYKEYLTNAPDLVFPQTADDGPRFLAVADVRARQGRGDDARLSGRPGRLERQAVGDGPRPRQRPSRRAS